MKTFIFYLALFCVMAAYASSGRAQESGVFLKLPLSPRASGMGGASTALADDPFGLYDNPAGMVYAKRPTVSLAYHI